MFGKLAATAVCLGLSASAASWQLTRAEHFEFYSQTNQTHTQAMLDWFEQLRPLFLGQNIVNVDRVPPVRVILFASAKDYDEYRIRSLSDAHFAASESRRYIAMYQGPDERRIAAHELAHVALGINDNMPVWLNEGLAEFFSTAHLAADSWQVGGDLAWHVQILRRRSLSPLSELAVVPADRYDAQMFYAQSWALTDMLIRSPAYAPGFQDALTALRRGASIGDAMKAVYNKSLDEVEGDLHAWLIKRASDLVRFPVPLVQRSATQTSDLADSTMRLVLADMFSAAGHLERAEAMLRELGREIPDDAKVAAALGAVALRKGDEQAARREWKRAIAQGIQDADLCYRYAALADAAGLPADEIRAALERAVLLRPEFDDARYRLALLDKNAGRYEIAVENFRAIKKVEPARAFNYWSILADALNELGKHDEALEAAHNAASHATTSDERAQAARLAYFAQTDFAVQFTRDSDGRAQMVTTRVPHQSAEDWNPFVEAGDDVRTTSGLLREVDCAGGETRLRVQSATATLTLAIPDPSRVRMRNAPEELVCGPQERSEVDVQYAASKSRGIDGLVRGIDFHLAK